MTFKANTRFSFRLWAEDAEDAIDHLVQEVDGVPYVKANDVVIDMDESLNIDHDSVDVTEIFSEE
ncbi:MAG: hypothetical protein ACO3O3_11495 [Ilumatobacteraceae bacterium]